MKRRLLLALPIAGLVFISAPLSIVIAIFLLPFWSWLEASAGIESVGHSGPAEWCYLLVYLLLVAGGLLGGLAFRRREKRRGLTSV